MTRFAEIVEVLVEAEAFDSKAFEGDAEWPQDLCDLMLALPSMRKRISKPRAKPVRR